MLEVADVFRRFADDYLTVHDIAKRGPMPASHRRAIADIMACRTEALGGHLWRCNKCSAEVYSYHSCKNRSCPKCHTDQTERWLEARKLEMLSCGYFHVTITVPKELRLMLRANKRDGYALLMKAAADSIIEIARDPRYVGATVGVLAVLHTWTQQLVYHLHVHCLVTAGRCPRRRQPLASRATRLPSSSQGPGQARARQAQSGAPKAPSRPRLAQAAWTKPWVVHCTAWGEGDEAVLRYLARYLFRIAITNSRIVDLDDNGVTIRYKQRKSGKWQTTRLSGHEFMRRFLQHVLPKGLHKVRYYGLWHSAQREHAQRARLLLLLDRSTMPGPAISSADTSNRTADHSANHTPSDEIRMCPCCKQGRLVRVSRLYPKQASGP